MSEALQNKPLETWIQALRFWRCSRNVRHGYVDKNNERQHMTFEQKLEDISFWSSGITSPKIKKRFEQLEELVLREDSYDEPKRESKTAS